MARIVAVFSVALLVLLHALQAPAQVAPAALVIGNGEYRNAPGLSTPVRDATAIAAALQRLGFHVIAETNRNERGMMQAMQYLNVAKINADITLIYYSGYAVQIDGKNWLIPIDANLHSKQDLASEAVSVDDLMQQSRGAFRARFLILDTCAIDMASSQYRDLQRTLFSRISQGLERIDFDRGAPGRDTPNNVIVYSVPPGHPGDDCSGEHTPFAEVLLRRVETPGLEINTLFRLVHDDTTAITKGRIEPVVDGSLSGRQVYFRMGPPGTASGNTTEMENIIWASIERSTDPADFETFLKQFPDSRFRQSAEAKLRASREMKEARVAAVPKAVPAVDADDAYRMGMEALHRNDFGQAMQYLRVAADGDSAHAMGQIGFLYEGGRGVPKDYSEALHWYQRAADRGDASSMSQIGFLLENGWGVQRDFGEAMNWYRKAAERANASAMNHIGMLYLNGLGVTRDDTEAFRWFRKSADLGDATAMNDLGVMYHNGTGVARDYAEAVRWFRKAAEGGSRLALTWLGQIYQNGTAVPRDYAEAMRWFKKAADAGDAVAMNRIGRMHELGLGVPKDMVQARSWMQRAVVAGDSYARQWLMEHQE